MRRAAARAAVGTAWCAALGLIAVSVVWGRAYQRDRTEIFLGAAPLVARDVDDGWDWRFGWGLVGAGAVATIVVGSVVRGWWWRAGDRSVVAASSLASGGFALLLASTDGADGVRHGAVHRTEYLANLAVTPPAGEFVRTFVERIDDYSVHVRGHPPGFVLVLKGLDAVGLGGGWPTALASVVATIALTAGVLVTVWLAVDAGWMRRVAPLLIVPPYMLWMVTSADAVYAAAGAWGVAACAVGLRRSGWTALAAGAVGGLLLASLLFMTYGGATFLLVPLTMAIAAWRNGAPGTARVIVAVIGAAATVTAAFAAAGFWWFAGAAETRDQYWAGTAQFRTWTYFGLANIAVALLALGPATFAGLTRLRDGRVWVLVGGGLLALIASHLSQYSRGEVERIWLPFYPWIAVAGAMLIGSSRLRSAVWVGLQAVGAIVLQAALVSKW